MTTMQTCKTALIWITEILNKYQIPFQISGGLAAHVYGATREIEDIDIEIPEDKFNVVKKEVLEFITYGPEQFKCEKWDLLLMTLNYQGQMIDLSGACHTKIFNNKTGVWQALSEDLSKAHFQNIFGLSLPVIPVNRLLAYKKVLGREVDIIDVRQIQNNGHKLK